MDQTARPFRSVLYIPASKPRALEKARTLPVDAIIFDLEDAVAVEEKPAARATLAEALARGGYGPRMKIVRINGLDTDWGADDARAAAGMGCDAILLPKVERADQVQALADLIGDAPIWAMMETPRGMLNAAQIAAHPQLQGFVMGTNDLAKDLNHPAQVAIANAAFAPSEPEIDLARRQIAAFEQAGAEGQGVAVVDGRIVENLHVATARATLAKADMIARLETA